MSEVEDNLESEQSGGEKLQVVKSALHNGLTKVLAGWKVSLLAACFPSLSKDYEGFLEAVRDRVVENVQRSLLEDFDIIIDEDITKSLEDYSTIVKNNSGPKGSIAWRPTRDPELTMLAHDAKVLRYEKQHILDSLKRAKQYSSKAQEAVSHGYKNCEENQLKIQRHLSVINESLKISESINEGLISDLWQTALLNSSDPQLKND